MLLFFNIGIPEILVVGVVILIFFGSKGTPGILRTLGKGIRQVRAASDELKQELKDGVNNIKEDVERERPPRPDEPPNDRPNSPGQ